MPFRLLFRFLLAASFKLAVPGRRSFLACLGPLAADEVICCQPVKVERTSLNTQHKLPDGKCLAVDSRFEAVDAGMIDAGGDGFEGMATGDFPNLAGRELADTALEDF